MHLQAYWKDLKFSDRQARANSEDPDQTDGSSLFAIPTALYGDIAHGRNSEFEF